MVASLAQSLVAVVLVYGGLSLLGLSARYATGLADVWLVKVSHAMVAAIGLALAWRGVRDLALRAGADAGVRSSGISKGSNTGDESGRGNDQRHAHGHAHGDDPRHGEACGHAHGPTVAQAEALRSWREAAALVASIAIRPCTGAVLLLVICWQTGLIWQGAAAVLAMGAGTAVFTAAVAAGGVALRGAALFAAAREGRLVLTFPILQIAVGLAVIAVSGLLLLGTTDPGSASLGARLPMGAVD